MGQTVGDLGLIIQRDPAVVALDHGDRHGAVLDVLRGQVGLRHEVAVAVIVVGDPGGHGAQVGSESSLPGINPVCASKSASRAPVAAENGMVVTAQHLATQVGVDVLKQGGNAVDAAVAVGYALAVVYPAAGNLGGGGFMTIQLADGRKTFLDFREKAPLAATANMYLDRDGNVVKGASTNGHLAVGVPGTVSGMEMARARSTAR